MPAKRGVTKSGLRSAAVKINTEDTEPQSFTEIFWGPKNLVRKTRIGGIVIQRKGREFAFQIAEISAPAHLFAHLIPGYSILRMSQHVGITAVELRAKFRRQVRIGHRVIGERIHGPLNKPAALVHGQAKDFGK